ncbi:PH domain-containing protein [Anaerobacillus sp. CMMVII]|uniref:PH domain-containing protein n=1 Tax=Anaerobacillus sp. CMMVII TaxID=2755588 RepID=UPI0021B815B5|nr:PH domain-containing protein [Anaerobacillus sp. CMMVII]MCT8138949.1 PH domain-containing protein [Anaerobacillus sp. CMMVII]
MSKGKRLHPVAIFLLFFSGLKELIVPIIAAFFFGRGAATWEFPFTLYFVIGGFLLLFFYGYLKWLTFTYEVNCEELRIKQGIMIKKNRFIRRERIYSIDITAGVLQRMFNLVAVKVETAGGGNEPEVLLTAVTNQDALHIKKQLLDVGAQTEMTNEQDIIQDKTELIRWKLTTQNLFLAALTSSGIGLAFMAILAIATQLEEWLGEQLIVDSLGYLFQSGLVLIVAMSVMILLLAWILSIISTLLKYGGFIIVKKDDELEITRGVLEKRQLTLSVSRITAIRVVESLLRQPFGLVTVYVESAGGGSKDEQLSTILFPLIQKRDLQRHLKEIIPDYSFDQPIDPLPKRAKKRYIIRKVIPATFLAGLAAVFIPYGYVGAVLVLSLSYLLGERQYKDAGVGNNDYFLWMTFRSISKTLVIIPRHRIQALEMKQSLFQKFRALYTIKVSILTSVFGKSFSLVDISKKQKEEIFSWYSYEK